MTRNSKGYIVLLSLSLFAGVVYSSFIGLYTPDFYAKETPNWQAQSIGQDIMNLFLVAPVLLISTLLIWRNNRAGIFIWAGTNLYLIYTFCLYTFDIHFNKLFLIYCINLGLSFYSFLYFIYQHVEKPRDHPSLHPRLIKIIAIYLMGIAFCFYGLWLMEVIPSIMKNTIPQSLEEVGLPTNGVHVIDLSVFLPGLFIVGILLLRKKFLGFLLSPVVLTFMVLMDLTIAGLMLMMGNRGFEVNMAVMSVMLFFALISGVLLAFFFKKWNSNNSYG